MARMRYVIKNPTQGYFTEMVVDKTTAVKLHGAVVGYEQTWRPEFGGMRHIHAAQFNTKDDAESLMRNEAFGAPASFEGCFAEPNTSEHEPD